MLKSSIVNNRHKGLRNAAKPGSSMHRGTIGILAVFSFPVLVSIAGLAIIMGVSRTERTDLQSLADAATLAGASCLIPNAICGNSGNHFPDFTTATSKANSTIDGYTLCIQYLRFLNNLKLQTEEAVKRLPAM